MVHGECARYSMSFLNKSRTWMWGPFYGIWAGERGTLKAHYTTSLRSCRTNKDFCQCVLPHRSSENSWKKVAFASQSMSDTAWQYAQIEKEALVTTWACEKFVNFKVGKHFLFETDHKHTKGFNWEHGNVMVCGSLSTEKKIFSEKFQFSSNKLGKWRKTMQVM